MFYMYTGCLSKRGTPMFPLFALPPHLLEIQLPIILLKWVALITYYRFEVYKYHFDLLIVHYDSRWKAFNYTPDR